MTTSKVDLKAGTFFFKIDKRSDNLILFNATNLEVSSDTQSVLHQACLGIEPELRFTAWRRRLLIGISSLDLTKDDTTTADQLPSIQA